MEYIKISEAERAIAFGYSNPDGVSERDVKQAHIVMNLWVSLIDESVPKLTEEFRWYLRRTPLCISIVNAKETLADLRNSQSTSRLDIWGALVNELAGDWRLCTILLGFPSRFTLADNVSLEASTIDTFRDTNKEVREYENSCTLPAWFEDTIAKIGRSILRNWPTTYAQTSWKLPSGATYECNRSASPAAKLVAANRLGFTYDGYFPGRPVADFHNCCTVQYDRRENALVYKPFRINPMKLVAVPKTVDKMRTIGMEETYRQLHLGRLGDAIALIYDGNQNTRLWCPAGRVTLHDQARNQELARKGSIDGSLATVDFSHASDSISAKIASLVLPPDLYSEICTYRANRYEYGGKRFFLNMFSTMGSRVTFPLETHIFWVLACAARDYAKRWFGINTSLDSYSVYGDDVIVPSSVAELFIQFAELAGFSPNLAKTYYTGYYRESCGDEFYHGLSAKGLYWPRRVVELDDTSGVEGLIMLQHRLCGEFPHTARLLGDLLLSIQPNLTYSPIGCDALTLWSAYPNLEEKEIAVPHGHGVVPGDPFISRTVRKVSRLHSYYNTQSRVTAEEAQARDVLAYIAELKGDRLYADPICENLGISLVPDRRRFTHEVCTSIRSRYEEV